VARNVYWTSNPYWDGGYSYTVMKQPLGGGPPVTFFSGTSITRAIAVDGQSAYWTTDAEVWKAALDGANPSVLMSAGTGNTLGALAVDSTHVYWLEYGNTNGVTDGALMKLDKAGGTGATLWAGATPFAFAVHDTNVYWVEEAEGSVFVKKVGTDGGTPVTVVPQDPYGAFVAPIWLNADAVFWSECGYECTGRILKIAK
jgi:hypothetical protein